MLDKISQIAPVISVHGNDETPDATRELPYQQIVTIARQRILLCHSHYPDRTMELESRRNDDWYPKLKRRIKQAYRAGARIYVYGHFHIPITYRQDDILLINPGAIASGNTITRQKVQTVALLFIRDDGQPLAVHVDLANPSHPYFPKNDWEAGFKAAQSQFSESILAPDITDSLLVAYKEGILKEKGMKEAVLRIAHRCWSGQQRFIQRSDLLSEIQNDLCISDESRTKLATLLARIAE